MVDWSALDYSMAPPGYRELRTSSALLPVGAQCAFVLSGRDCLEWLQGQATNDIRLLESLPWLDFCLTRPTGQMLSVCRAWRSGDSLVISTAEPDALLERVEQTVILEDVALTKVEEPYRAVQGPGARPTELSLLSDRTGSGGFEVPLGEEVMGAELSADGLYLATLEAGIPIRGLDWNERTLPPELGKAFEAAHVSYAKGCYTGQEVLMRIKARGHTNKTWVGLRSASPIPVGATVVHEGREVGTVHRSATSPAFGPIASATVKNEAATAGTKVSVGGVAAVVAQMPFVS